MASRVFKIPDGDGGILYRVQTPDGRWHETDEKGNILPGEGGGAGDGTESPSGAAAPGPAIPKGRRKGKPSPAAKEGSHVNFSIHFTKEEYREFSDYIHWRCLFRESCTKASFLLGLALEAVRRDGEYREFRRRNP